MEHLKRIKSLSTKLRYILTFLLFFLPFITLMYWLFFNSWPLSLREIAPIPMGKALSFQEKGIGLVVSVLPLMLEISAILTLTKLFHLYEKGLIFTADNVQCFRKLGKILILWFIAYPLYTAILSVALTFRNPPGERMLSISLDSADITALIVGIMLMVISWVMDEARMLEEEVTHTI